MLEGPRPCTIFCFAFIHYAWVTLPKRFYWLVPRSVVNNYCVLCTVKAKKEGNNHSPLLTMVQPTNLHAYMLRYNYPFLFVCFVGWCASDIKEYVKKRLTLDTFYLCLETSRNQKKGQRAWFASKIQKVEFIINTYNINTIKCGRTYVTICNMQIWNNIFKIST